MKRLTSLNQLRGLRGVVTGWRKSWLRLRYGIDIAPSASVSLTARMIAGRRGAIAIGAESLVAFKTLIVAREAGSGSIMPVRVGSRCFIGGGSVLMPGVTIGDNSIVAAGAVVMEDVPPRSIVAGVPAQVIRSDIETGPFGRLAGAAENTARLWRP